MLLAKAGLDVSSLNDPDRYLPYRNVLRAIEIGGVELGVSDFGLRLADAKDPSFLGVLWLAIQSARSVRDGLLMAARHMHYHAPGIAIEVRKARDSSHEEVELRLLLPDPPLLPQATEHSVSHICKVVRILSEGKVSPSGIHFRHAPVGSKRQYRQHLGLVPCFQSTFDGIVVESVAWRRQLPRQNDQLQTFVERYLVAAEPRARASLIDQVLQILRTQMRLGPVSLMVVAHLLHLHPRTLQRRLQENGQTFEMLKDTVRRELAGQLLTQAEIGLSQVAQLLDFADQSVLTRACQRWFGKPPSAVRRESLARSADH
ncbi:HTH-type transcriptional regulator VirS [Cupriavidus yeoncheonensis]|uniref:HTH-type transcriptional regulator VirS n=2 Tax=Cupriavidus yeoncheonensis TaxID=1462994 RepID=A0A916IZ22_9BURK|nr:HTH-type transcriptional regulator VirS [Cupriavidus yeoncheonensis]